MAQPPFTPSTAATSSSRIVSCQNLRWIYFRLETLRRGLQEAVARMISVVQLQHLLQPDLQPRHQRWFSEIHRSFTGPPLQPLFFGTRPHDVVQHWTRRKYQPNALICWSISPRSPMRHLVHIRTPAKFEKYAIVVDQKLQSLAKVVFRTGCGYCQTGKSMKNPASLESHY